MLTTENFNGTALQTADWSEDLLEAIFGDNGKQAKSPKPAPFSLVTPLGYETEQGGDTRLVLAIFCFEDADSVVGQFVRHLAGALAKGVAVHLFARKDFAIADVALHVVGDSQEGDLVDHVQEFARRAGNEFLRLFQTTSAPLTLLGCEWSTMPVLTLLHGIKNLPILWSLHSLECERSDMTSDLSKRIEEIELAGLRAAKAILVHNEATAVVAKSSAPECGDRIVNERQVFPVAHFNTKVDPGQVKARYQVGPIDPTILFVGDLSERYGPDILLKAMPAILKNHPQARLIVVGAGALYWPLRVYTRYLLIEHAVRLAGSVEGQALQELIQAADIIAVPSRATTPWWPFLAGWAAHRPVVATHEAAPGILTNEEDSVLCYPNENSCVWGIERILYDAELGRSLAAKGHDKLQERFGWKNVAAQVASLLGVAVTPVT
ncbi:MAG TPA: glycosyltransferase family 4 protein [Gemmataceae bacterium]|jgi:glycosyltransferase involved in cell wall biosynthesis|nr:glycosyltransferase family 4 protein [Gemmataceae bacterium]